MPMLKILRWLPITLSVKTKFHSRTSKALSYQLLCQVPITSLNSLPDILYLAHLAPAMLVSSVFLEHVRLTPTLLSLYLGCSFPGQPQDRSSHCLQIFTQKPHSQ